MKHVMSVTYKPKIERMRAGDVRQTIRPLGPRPVCVGDTILFHGWKGVPYRSPWSWRLEVVVKEVINIYISKYGMLLSEEDTSSKNLIAWYEPKANEIAALDGIVPPTGIELKRVLFGELGGRTGRYQVIRW